LAKATLREARKFAPKPRADQKMTCMKIVNKDPEKLNMHIKKMDNLFRQRSCTHTEMANNRNIWQVVVNVIRWKSVDEREKALTLRVAWCDAWCCHH
jgi:hypothetical protein